MAFISVFDILKIGIGPSSSHTLGPWKAALQWIDLLKKEGAFKSLEKIEVHLFGSLSLTGKGHATDVAIQLGLCGEFPEKIKTESIATTIQKILETQKLNLGGEKEIAFNPQESILFKKEFLPHHANGMIFLGTTKEGTEISTTYYSIGGGFILEHSQLDNKSPIVETKQFPYPIFSAEELVNFCVQKDCKISDIVLENEKHLENEKVIDTRLKAIWDTMLHCMYEGCHTEGFLPGGLNVKRRAYDMYQRLKEDHTYHNPEEWLESIRKVNVSFRQILKWVSCFALSVNEVNASLGRVVTAPTNGSAGVIPAVLMYYLTIENHKADFHHIKQFLLVAAEVGSIFKKGSTLSAAMGGCQAEIGVSSAMAAGALTELLGGSPQQVVIACEIAMEHHLGLTCDPIKGLVQIPCIERNAMGAIKAINAAELALETNEEDAKVSLDSVIKTMWETAKDMNAKYKETSQGGLAVSVIFPDC